MAALARGCLVGIIAFAAASFFLSDGNDVRFWLLLGAWADHVRRRGTVADGGAPGPRLSSTCIRGGLGRSWTAHLMPTNS